MAKKKLMSAKARLALKILTAVWLLMVILLILGIGTDGATRELPKPAYAKGPAEFRLPQGEPDEAYKAYRDAFIAARYVVKTPIVVGAKTIPAGTELHKDHVQSFMDNRYTGPMELLDPKKLRSLVAEKLIAREDIHSRRKGYEGPPLVAKGEKIDSARLRQLVLHGWEGEPIPVKGHDKIIGINLTLPFVALNFLFLVVLLYGILWEPILKILDERAEIIRVDLETAQTERTDASELKGQYTDQLAKINQERVALIDRGRKEGYEERERIVGEARAEAEKVVASGKAEIEAATEKARKELMAQISDLSADMATEIIRREIRPADHKALIDGFVAKMDDTQLN